MIEDFGKVSIIVPVYNVEKYLRQCLNSIIGQTYKNIEIIVINDGSTDSSGNICDEYAKKDERIKIIHKQNGGLSDARNYGLKVMTGKYLLFIDSDDYVNLEYTEKLIEELIISGSDIVICDYFRLKNNILERVNIQQWPENEDVKQITQLMLCDYVNSHVWNKVYYSDLYHSIEFPFKKTYEDMYITYKIFDKSKKISYLKQPLYYYRINKAGISLSPNPQKAYDIFCAFKERYIFAKTKYPEVKDYCLNLATISAFNAYNTSFLLNIIQYKEDVFLFIKDNYKDINNEKSINIKYKNMAFLLIKCKLIYKTLLCIKRFLFPKI